MFHFRVCPKLVYCLCICHGLEARLCVLLFILDLLWRELVSWSFILHSLLPLRAGPWLIMGFSLLNPLFSPSVNFLAFLPCHSVIPAVVLFDSCLLGLFWASCMFFFHLITVTQSCHWAYIHATSGLLDPFHCLQASFAHFFLLRHSRTIFFLWAPLAHSTYAFS